MSDRNNMSDRDNMSGANTVALGPKFICLTVDIYSYDNLLQISAKADLQLLANILLSIELNALDVLTTAIDGEMYSLMFTKQRQRAVLFAGPSFKSSFTTSVYLNVSSSTCHSKQRSPAPCHSVQRKIVSANSLEDSKRKAKSQYDNIPDLNQQYLAELSWVERKYGPERLKKDLVKEAQSSILRPPGPSAPAQPSDSTRVSEAEPDLAQYTTYRNELLGNTLFLGALGLCGVWLLGTMRDVQSFFVGLLGSVAYVYLLSRSVDRLATAARETGKGSADALQPARIAILVLLVIASAKNSDKLSVLPVLFGFFTYKVATLIPLLTGEAFD